VLETAIKNILNLAESGHIFAGDWFEFKSEKGMERGLLQPLAIANGRPMISYKIKSIQASDLNEEKLLKQQVPTLRQTAIEKYQI